MARNRRPPIVDPLFEPERVRERSKFAAEAAMPLPAETPMGRVALRFASALVAGDHGSAHALLAPVLADSCSEADLARAFEAIVGSWGLPVTGVEVREVMAFWPGKRDGDVGWAYAAISGEGYSEAITVVVTEVGGELLIRQLEWGRP